MMVYTWLQAVVGEGNGNPLQYSCLENPRDRGTCLWGCTESDTTEATWQKQQQQQAVVNGKSGWI